MHTQIKLFLLECVNAGLCQVFPSWCTSYKDYKTSVQAIKEAIKEMSVLELNELVKACEEEFGVSAAAPVAVVGGAAAGAGRAEGRRRFRHFPDAHG